VLHHQADEPWLSSTRRHVLIDLARGVEDWTTDAASNAMVVAAWAAPNIRDDAAGTVCHRFLDALLTYQQREARGPSPCHTCHAGARLCLLG